jgi:hypothetical protein
MQTPNTALFCNELHVAGAVQSAGDVILQSFRQTCVPLIMLQMCPGAQAADEVQAAPSVPTRVVSRQPQSGLS